MLFTFRVVEKKSLNYRGCVYSGQKSIAFELAIIMLIITKRTKIIMFQDIRSSRQENYINIYIYIYIYMYIYRAYSVLTF